MNGLLGIVLAAKLDDAGVEAACEKKRKERKDPSTELGSPQVGPQANVGAGDVWFWVIWTEGVDDDVANAVFAKGMRLQGERGVILTPVCGENAHHVVLPAGKLANDSPSGNPYLILMKPSVASPSLPGECQICTRFRDTTLLNARDIDNPALGPFDQPEAIPALRKYPTTIYSYRPQAFRPLLFSGNSLLSVEWSNAAPRITSLQILFLCCYEPSAYIYAQRAHSLQEWMQAHRASQVRIVSDYAEFGAMTR
ncbi:hypothetical protein EDB92DRAFT_1817310 [Lactarius akahatsu]|uniref:Uncharacterized protein n=1 Tax=Lactarius akahatsu TaxID=416441 RepID=A0AAD4LIM2_9AGAM|nr:hypothetical protein EDB92DRAFT_1817310 [Lactarius akahatsu]